MSQRQEVEICSNSNCNNPLPPRLLSSSDCGPQQWQRHYRKLDEDAKEIRLIRIKPGHPADQLECELLYTPLFESLSPEQWQASEGENGSSSDLPAATFMWRALSYVWGPPPKVATVAETVTRFVGETRHCSIFINGDEAIIGSNLYECLFFLRYLGYREPIWIDALCINQRDLVERRVQVQTMSEIYAAAWEVIIYISWDLTNKCDLATVGQDMQTTDIFRDDSILDEAIIDFFIDSDDQPLLHVIAEVLRCRDDDSYWKRLWAVQERAFARKLTVVSGATKLPWRRLLQVQERQLHLFCFSIGREDQVWRALAAWMRNQFLSTASIVREALRRRGSKDGMLELVCEHCSISLCTDPRDYVYAMVGMVKHTQKRCAGIKSDYTLCMWCVERNATVCIIQDTDKLDIMATGGFRWDSNILNNTQVTWVPDWAHFNLSTNEAKHYQFSPSNKAEWQLSPDCRQLHGSGLVLGSVTLSPHRVDFGVPSLRLPFQGQVRKAICHLGLFIRDNIINESYQEQCWQDMATLYTEWWGNEAKKDQIVRVMFKAPSDLSGQGAHPGEEYVSKALLYLLPILCKKKVFIVAPNSGRPRLGLGLSPHMKQGDIVCGILGCRVPLVIRRGEDGDRIIGPCWIGGYGRGQAIEELEAGKRTRETFCFI